ncbi:MGAT4C [Branchiostoma lanceolatum]|uniref:MGAT4C protein n=1 Tax=Branchiostoma lanceolatum TaxID=7740 RepID=A0A8J9ZJV4_BRALA|nr:MGAT4C [Branchiostoma lanceolatum]
MRLSRMLLLRQVVLVCMVVSLCLNFRMLIGTELQNEPLQSDLQNAAHPCELQREMLMDSLVTMNETLHRRQARTERSINGFLTIGIPTVKRDQNATYLVSTLDSLIEHTTAAEREQIVVVVFLADFDTDYNRNLSLEISRKYSQHLDNGFMQIIQAPQSFYPTLEGLKIKFKDSPERVRWRSKQCVDYAFLFQYCLNLSEYYLQLEDDIVSTQNFLTGIKEYLGRVKDDWTMLEFSELGFIGKLFRSSELQRFADFLLLFYQELPSDLLLHTFLHIMRPDMQPNAKKFIKPPSQMKNLARPTCRRAPNGDFRAKYDRRPVDSTGFGRIFGARPTFACHWKLRLNSARPRRRFSNSRSSSTVCP